MEKTIIAFKDFEYIVSMESFFKNEYKSGSRNYLIPIISNGLKETFFQK